MLKVGDIAPDFVGPSSNGGEVRLSDFTARGPVVLYFYNKNFSVGCTEEAKMFRDNARKLAALGASVIGVSKDTLESHQAFVKALVLGYPLVSDPDRRIIRQFKVRTFFGVVDRVTFVMDRERVVRLAYRSLFDWAGHLDATVSCVRALAPAQETAAPAEG